MGLKSHSSSVPARHLDADHPQVEAVKLFVERCGHTHNVHKRLVANFDQVWTTLYEHSKKVIYKPEENAGEHKSPHKPSMQKMISSIRVALGIEDGKGLWEQPEAVEKTYNAKKPVLNAAANISPIEGWRFPRTTTTLSWADGDLGASWITVKDGAAPEHIIKKLNEEMSGLLHIHCQDSKTHMWSSSTMLHYLEFLSVQLRMKRLKHGLSTQDKALIFCDKASVHSCTAFQQLRERWEKENGAIICHGSSSCTVKVPPGWGAVGAPNDGWHQFYHLIRQSYQKVACGQGRHMALRAALGDLDLAVDGSVRFTMLALVCCIFIFLL